MWLEFRGFMLLEAQCRGFAGRGFWVVGGVLVMCVEIQGLAATS